MPLRNQRNNAPPLRGAKRIGNSACSNVPSKARNQLFVKPAIGFFTVLVLCYAASHAGATSKEAVYKPNSPLKQTIEQQPAPEETAKKEEKSYTYDPAGKTDPFKSFIAEQEEMAEKVKRKPRTYLETLDLSQLELIAIVTGPQGNYAMVRDSKGVGHVIIKGTAIGTNGGVVEKITEKEVIIKEEYRDLKGIIKSKDVSKKLPSLM